MSGVLVVMRRAEMVRVHPRQVDRVCARCGEKCGVYPSGQAALKKDRTLEIVCNVCAERDKLAMNVPAPGALDEIGQGVDVRSPEERERATEEFVREMRKKGWKVQRGGDRE